MFCAVESIDGVLKVEEGSQIIYRDGQTVWAHPLRQDGNRVGSASFCYLS